MKKVPMTFEYPIKQGSAPFSKKGVVIKKGKPRVNHRIHLGHASKNCNDNVHLSP